MTKLFAASIAIALLFATPAFAVTITGSGQTFDIAFDGQIEGSTVAGLSALVSFEVVSFSGTSIILDIDITNNSHASIWDSSRISAIGFDTDPVLNGANVISGLFDYAVLYNSFPNGFGSIDVCFLDNMNNCNGGGSEGIWTGQTSSIRVELLYDDAITRLELSNFGVRYQSLSSSELGFDDDSGTGGEAPIPEPSAALLFAAGALVTATRVRRQR